MSLGASRSICRFGGSLYVISAPLEVLSVVSRGTRNVKRNHALCDTVLNEQWADAKCHVHVAVRVLIGHRTEEEWDIAFF